MRSIQPIVVGPYSYDFVTTQCCEQIHQHMIDARRQSGVEAQLRKERAYGVYLVWRALVSDTADPFRYFRDDRRLEALLA